MINDIKVRPERTRILSQPVAHGLLASALVALGAQFLSDHYGAGTDNLTCLGREAARGTRSSC